MYQPAADQFDDQTTAEADPTAHVRRAGTSSKRLIAGTTLVAYPDYRATNPYQDGLYHSFGADLRVEYGPIQHAIDLIERSSGSQPVLFHLHWPDPLFADCTDRFDYQVRASEFLHAIRLFQARGGAFLWTVHNSLPHEPIFEDLALHFHARLAAAANVIHVHSDAAIAELRRHYAVDENKCIVAPHGSYEGCYGRAFDTHQSRQLLGLEKVETLILCFGQIRSYKGVDGLVRAFHGLAARPDRDHVHLLIAGKVMGDFTPAHARLLEEAHPQIHVMDGFAPDAKLPLLFGAADVIALPYRQTLTSGALMLAALYGKPVVAPRLPALDAVDAIGLGVRYDPEAPDALESALDRALRLGDRQRGAIRRAGRTWSKAMSWDQVSAGFHNAIAERLTPDTRPVEIDGESRTLSVLRRPQPERSLLAIGLVSNDGQDNLAAQLTALTKLQAGRPHVYLFDCNPRHRPDFGLHARVNTLLSIDAPIGFAAAANRMLALMRADGCEQALLLDPTLHLDGDALDHLLAHPRPDAMVAPLTLGDNGHVAAGGYRCCTQSDGHVHLEPILVGEDPLLNRRAYKAQASPAPLLIPLTLLDRVGFLPENAVTAQAIMDWTLRATRQGIPLVIEPSSQARPAVADNASLFPGIETLYHDVRAQVQRALALASPAARASPRLVADHVERRHIAPLRKGLAKSHADLLPLFDRCVRAGVEDGMAGVTEMVDVPARIDAVALTTEAACEGRIDRKNAAHLTGWAVERSKDGTPWRPAALWLFQNGQPLKRILPHLDRADLVAAGYGSAAGFDFAIPRSRDGEPERFDLRYAANGRRVPVSTSLKGDIWHMSPPATTGVKPRLKAMLESVGDGQLKGWALDLAHPDIALALDIFVDNELVARDVMAEIDRPDLRRAGLGDGRHGFSLHLPNRFLLRESLSIELRLAGTATSLTKKNLAVANDPRGFSAYASLGDHLRWGFCEDRMGAGHADHALTLLSQLELQKRLLVARAQEAQADTFVSIIMPVLNRAAIIGDAIASVLAQSHAHFELIIIDDGSTDDLSAALERCPDPRILLISNARNEGVSAARNRGLDRASGEIIAYLDSDNSWDPDYLAVMVNALADHRGHACAYAGQSIFQAVTSADGAGQEERRAIRLCPFNRSRLEERNYIDLNIFVHRRHLMALHGGFDKSLHRLVDWDLILRYTCESPPLMVPALLGAYRAGAADNQITATEDFARNRRRLRIASPASRIAGSTQEPRPLDMLVNARSSADLSAWAVANARLRASATGMVAGVWMEDGRAFGAWIDPQTGQLGDAIIVDRIGALLRDNETDRPMLVIDSAHVLSAEWASALDRISPARSYVAATGRLYGPSRPGRFGSLYHDMTPERISAAIIEWSLGPALHGQSVDRPPKEYVFIPVEHINRLKLSASLSRSTPDMLDHYFDSFATEPVSSLYLPDLIACHRDDIPPWA